MDYGFPPLTGATAHRDDELETKPLWITAGGWVPFGQRSLSESLPRSFLLSTPPSESHIHLLQITVINVMGLFKTVRFYKGSWNSINFHFHLDQTVVSSCVIERAPSQASI